MRERALRQCEALRGKIVQALGGETAVGGGSSGAAPGGEPRRTRTRTRTLTLTLTPTLTLTLTLARFLTLSLTVTR